MENSHQGTHESARRHGGHAHQVNGPTLFWRSVAILRPDRQDIATVLIFALVVGLFSLATPIAVEALVTTVMFGSLVQPLVVLALTLFVFLSMSAAMRYLQIYVMEMIQRRIFMRIALQMAHRLPRISQEAFQGHYPPELVNRFLETTSFQKQVATLVLDGVTIVIQVVVGLTILAFYHPFMIGFDIVLLSMLVFAAFVLGRRGVATAFEESTEKYNMAAWLEDIVRCQHAFRSEGARQFALRRASDVARNYVSYRDQHWRILRRQIIFVLAIEAIASAVLLGLGGWLVLQGSMTLGQLVAAELIVTTIVGAMAKLIKHTESYYDVMASVGKLELILALPIEESTGRLLQGDSPSIKVEWSGLSLMDAGRPSERMISSGTIEPGERLAILGGDDWQRHQFADIVAGFVRPEQGYVLFDGMNLRDLSPDQLAQAVALVRNIEIFEGTLAENVHLGRPVSDPQVVQRTLECVSLWSEVLNLSLGLDSSLVRSAGRPLSDHQLQRLMIARALAGQPRFLVLDGILDALPLVTSKSILSALASFEFTLLLLTERPELTEQCTRVVDWTQVADERSRGSRM